MNPFFKNMIATAASPIPLPWLRKSSRPPVILLYHTISYTQPDYITGYHVKSEKQFEKDIDYILKHYHPATLEETINNPDKNNIHFTFDDGLKECYTLIAPLLKKKGIPATFFINSDFVGNNHIFPRFIYDILANNNIYAPISFRTDKNISALKKIASIKNINFDALIAQYKPYMNVTEIKSLHNDGFTIGAHSIDHPEFFKITPEEQYRQIYESMAWINNNIAPSIKTFAFPYTDDGVSNQLLNTIFEEKLVDITFGTAGLKFDSHPNHYQRIPMEKKKYCSGGKILKFEYLYFLLKSIVNKNTVIRNE